MVRFLTCFGRTLSTPLGCATGWASAIIGTVVRLGRGLSFGTAVRRSGRLSCRTATRMRAMRSIGPTSRTLIALSPSTNDSKS